MGPFFIWSLVVSRSLKNSLLFKILNFYPPFLGAGVKVKKLNKMGTKIEVSMNLTRFNKNYVGTHFGGSLYSMCDPFYMLILIQLLGRDYIVWDKAATINFKNPGRGRVHAIFEIGEELFQSIKNKVDEEGKYEPILHVEVKDDEGRIVCEISKTLWIKRKAT